MRNITRASESAPVSSQSTTLSSPFLTPQQLATRWQCSVVKLRRMRKAGVLPSHTVGSLIRFSLSDIEACEASWKKGVAPLLHKSASKSAIEVAAP